MYSLDMLFALKIYIHKLYTLYLCSTPDSNVFTVQCVTGSLFAYFVRYLHAPCFQYRSLGRGSRTFHTCMFLIDK
jgi:hypothetical protein